MLSDAINGEMLSDASATWWNVSRQQCYTFRQPNIVSVCQWVLNWNWTIYDHYQIQDGAMHAYHSKSRFYSMMVDHWKVTRFFVSSSKDLHIQNTSERSILNLHDASPGFAMTSIKSRTPHWFNQTLSSPDCILRRINDLSNASLRRTWRLA